MNPKITVVVNTNNRATCTVTGIASVGALVDIEVTGLSLDGIPDWGLGSGYTGKSLRFRLVNEYGEDVMLFPLPGTGGATSSQRWTVSGGALLATNVSFDTDRMRTAFDAVPYNEGIDFGVVLDSTVDKAEYATGHIKIPQWVLSRSDAPTVLPDWREELNARALKPTMGDLPDQTSVRTLISSFNALLHQLKGIN